jgi:sugar phosphate isomerase/epimerase
MKYTRRSLGTKALAAFSAARLLAQPNSKFGGVQIGINAPYSFRGMPGSADDILRNLLQLGLSSVELRSQPVEAFLGAPNGGPVRRGPAGKGAAPTPEQEAAQRAAAEELRKWRLSLAPDKFKSFRKKYEDAGVHIDIVKLDPFGDIDQLTDAEIDYFFEMTKTLGARIISCEPPVSKTERIGKFADKHKVMMGYHGHTEMKDPEHFGSPSAWERSSSYAKYNGINLDIGHYTAAGGDAMAFIERYHARITHVHLKDRKANMGPNVPWGQGDTPIKQVLQEMKKKKYPFQATIEYEYDVPQGSSLMAELAKCVQFCKESLA